MLAKKYKIVRRITYYKRIANPPKDLVDTTICSTLKCPNGDCYSRNIICEKCTKIYKEVEVLCTESGVRNKYVYIPTELCS